MRLSKAKRVLVIAAHPDDEVIGCGGTIARHGDNGDHVEVLIVSEGATSRQPQRDRSGAFKELSALGKAAQAAGSILGAAGVELLDFPDNRLDSLDRLDLIKQIENRNFANKTIRFLSEDRNRKTKQSNFLEGRNFANCENCFSKCHF